MPGRAKSVLAPTADQVARLVVAAAKETGARPQNIFRQDRDFRSVRARAYVALALIDLFSLTQPVAARLCGSTDRTIEQTLYRKRKGKLDWWCEASFYRIESTVRFKPKPPPAAKPAKPDKLGKLEATGYRAPPQTMQRVLEDEEDSERPIFDVGGKFSEPKPRREVIEQTKGDLYAILRDAAANTAKMGRADA